MSKFNFQLDENGNVSNIVFPKTNIEVGIEYPEPTEDTEDEEIIKPSKVSIAGQSMSVEDFSDLKVEKDENGNISVGTSSGHRPWWWDWFNKNLGVGGSIKPISENGGEE